MLTDLISNKVCSFLNTFWTIILGLIISHFMLHSKCFPSICICLIFFRPHVNSYITILINIQFLCHGCISLNKMPSIIDKGSQNITLCNKINLFFLICSEEK